MRKQGKVVSQGVLTILGVDEDGYREILSVDLASTETGKSVSRVFHDLRKRGLKGVLLVVSDDHEGLRSAQNEILSRSRVAKGEEFHFLHNLLDLVPKKERKELTAEVRSIFDSPDLYFALLDE